MAITDQSLGTEFQYALLEPTDGGVTYNSGLYTSAEVAARLNYRANMFNMETGIFTSRMEQAAISSSKAQDLTTGAPDLIDILNVAYSYTGTMAAGGTYYNIPRGSSVEGDEYITTQTAISLPSLYTIDTAKPLQINFFPAPTFSATDGQIQLIYMPRLGVFPATPDGTTFTAGFPDDFTPFVKYGVLADLFGKSGETYDPMRASLCESIYQLGVEIAKSWLSGSPQT